MLEGAWAEPAQSGVWGTPEGLDPSLEAFRTWLRHLLWELTLLLVQVWLSFMHSCQPMRSTVCPICNRVTCREARLLRGKGTPLQVNLRGDRFVPLAVTCSSQGHSLQGPTNM